MKVLLVEDVDKLGWLGDVIEVSSGYARNYLLSQGLAVIPTEAKLKSLSQEQARRAELRLNDRDKLEKTSEAVNGAEAVLAAKANEQGHLFGSVGEKQIAENLREQGFEVPDKAVELVEHLKNVGTHEVNLKFADDLTATINVIIVAEGLEAEQEHQEEEVVCEENESENESTNETS